MKKILIISALIFAVFTSLNAEAQSGSQDFMGVKLGQSLSATTAQLEAKGFSVTEVSKNATGMKGQFAGEKRTIAIYATENAKSVYRIIVGFDTPSTWYSAKSMFNDLKESLTKKYGKPSLSRASFSSPYYEGDGYEMSALRLGKANFIALWKTEYGEIAWLLGNKNSLLSYSDNAASAINEKEEQTTTFNDL